MKCLASATSVLFYINLGYLIVSLLVTLMLVNLEAVLCCGFYAANVDVSSELYVVACNNINEELYLISLHVMVVCTVATCLIISCT
jgi:hypothetical protein